MLAHILKTSDPVRSAWRWVVLLVLLSSPLGCDQNPAAPTTWPGPRAEASLLSPIGSITSPSVFDGSHYLGLDLNYAVQFQYGTTAKAVLVFNHLFGWRAQVGTQLYPIDMQRAVHDLYGSAYRLAAVGVGAYDWRAVNLYQFSTNYTYPYVVTRTVLPVMIIASDYFYNVGAVQQALANFESVLTRTRTWYAQAMTTYGGPSMTFRLLQPLVVFNQSSYTAAQWNALATGLSTSNFLNAAVQEYSNAYTQGPNNLLRAVVIPFTGLNTGVSGRGGGFYVGSDPINNYFSLAVGAPQAGSETCPATGTLDASCSSASYWIGHELGRAFGLQECAEPNPGLCQYSIMFDFPAYLSPSLGNPFLTPDQITALANTGFLFP
jgi:hypothetical protein